MSRPPIDRQREHQANERTFLAWLRTSIALISFGFAIARFGLFLRQLGLVITRQASPTNQIFNSQNLGLGMVIFGIALIALAAWRYSQVFWQIERGDYQPSRTTADGSLIFREGRQIVMKGGYKCRSESSTTVKSFVGED